MFSRPLIPAVNCWAIVSRPLARTEKRLFVQIQAIAHAHGECQALTKASAWLLQIFSITFGNPDSIRDVVITSYRPSARRWRQQRQD
jgi:hypothetical protein